MSPFEFFVAKNQIGIVDDDDRRLVTSFAWKTIKRKDGQLIVVTRNASLPLSHIVMGLLDRSRVRYRNLNTLDNRKGNLKVCYRKRGGLR